MYGLISVQHLIFLKMDIQQLACSLEAYLQRGLESWREGSAVEGVCPG